MIADRLEVDPWELISLANRHPRVNILRPGPGVGGHCIAVDPWFIVHAAPEDTPLIRSARATNLSKTEWLFRKLSEEVTAKGGEVACLGLAYKADVDDLRESPALWLAGRLGEEFPGRVLAVEPHVDALPEGVSGVRLVGLDEALASAEVIAVLVGHRAFDRVRTSLEPGDGRTVIDAVGLLRDRGG
jgi:UDP-N-acetyl-D-mannosaminuronic acid dehydrogenase